MYADHVASGAKRSIRDRLNGVTNDDLPLPSSRDAKRQRQTDGMWRRVLYEDDRRSQISKAGVSSEDLRLKLQRKDSQQAILNKLSGKVRPRSENTESLKPKPVAQCAKPVQKSDVPTIEAKISVLRKMSAPTTSGKQSQQKVQASVEGLLKSLGLEKYLVTFRAEEVDMTALRHLTDEDLKSLGIPMGPRKKILLAVNSKTKNDGNV
uniref:SAM domain-containing protein n=1 Tax=Ananas comosus var. bracteatus TaxID=296719 RepID=A0A6V7Q799_ANACO|nr:unnamed protein product [Ananas comosus var. bracteatus]